MKGDYGESPKFAIGAYSLQSTYVRPRRHPYLFRLAAAEVSLAEQLGFDAVWSGHHHFSYDGYSPAPIPALTRYASATESIAVGAGILLFGLHTPREIAAQCAAFHDVLPGRRLRLAMAAGYVAKDFAAHRVEFKRRGRILEENLDELLTKHGEELGPTEIWMGGTSDAAIRRAGRFGASLLLPQGTGPEQVRRIRELWAESHGGGDPWISVQCDLWPDRGDGEAEWMRRRIAESWKGYLLYDETWDGSGEAEFVEACTGVALLGPSEAIVEHVGQLIESGVDEIYFRVRFDGTSHGQACDHLQRISETVIPQLTDR